MSQSIDETLRKIELLEKQDVERKKMLKELRSDLLKFNLSSGGAADLSGEAEPNSLDEEIVSIDNTRVEEIPDIVEPLLIAVTGAKARAGTTHHAISIAHHLSRNKKRIAVMEYNDSGEFSSMGRYFNQEAGQFFCNQDVKYYPACTLQLLDQLSISEEFDFIVLDLGAYTEEKTLYARSDIKIIVSSGKPWELDSLLPVFQSLSKSTLKESFFLFNFTASADAKSKILSGMGDLPNVFFPSYISDPFEEIDGELETLFAEYLEAEEEVREEKKKLTHIFRRKKDEKKEGRRKYDLVPAISGIE